MWQFRICWSADSNINFRGQTEWLDGEEYLGNLEDRSQEEVQGFIWEGNGDGSLARKLFEEAAGINYWTETREI